ncbi:MAG: hypothetical protein R6Y91_09205, partial [Desulfohalobium sp.]
CALTIPLPYKVSAIMPNPGTWAFIGRCQEMAIGRAGSEAPRLLVFEDKKTTVISLTSNSITRK